MESMSLQQVQVVEELLKQIQQAIANLEDWNAQLSSVDDLLMSPDGMKTLAADCMLLEAIGESVKKVDVKTSGCLLPLRPEIPWKQVIGMRDHIAHGYFDINTDFVWDVIQNDLKPLREAVEYFLDNLYEIVPIES